MKAAKAAKVKVGERVRVWVDDNQETGNILAVDEHGLALSLVGEGRLEFLVYFAWATVSSVYWLGGRDE